MFIVKIYKEKSDRSEEVYQGIATAIQELEYLIEELEAL